MKICIFCASSDTLAPEYYEQANAFGHALAVRGHSLIFGGSADGLMSAAADGVKAGGGHVCGIAPRFLGEAIPRYPGCDELIYTDTMDQRKAKMLEMSDAFAVLPGGLGTLDEFFCAVTLRQMGQLPKPFVLLNTDGFFDTLGRFLSESMEKGFIGKSFAGCYAVVNTPEEAVEYLEKAAAEPGQCRGVAEYNR